MAALAEEYESVRSHAGERGVSFYFAVGSQNHDERGMILDGEATLVISGGPAALGLLDMYFLMARSTWLNDLDELDQHIPPPDGFFRWLARLIRLTL